jgi:hypothetical protein
MCNSSLEHVFEKQSVSTMKISENKGISPVVIVIVCLKSMDLIHTGFDSRVLLSKNVCRDTGGAILISPILGL